MNNILFLALFFVTGLTLCVVFWLGVDIKTFIGWMIQDFICNRIDKRIEKESFDELCRISQDAKTKNNM